MAGLALLSSACGLLPIASPRRIPRIGHLRYGLPELVADRVEAFRQGLAELGYIEGQTINIEWRFTPESAGQGGSSWQPSWSAWAWK
jgi:putative ABC transport system substrate-binding protein